MPVGVGPRGSPVYDVSPKPERLAARCDLRSVVDNVYIYVDVACVVEIACVVIVSEEVKGVGSLFDVFWGFLWIFGGILGEF
jgi:hypothetical protein